MKSHRAESDPGRARGVPVFAREVGNVRESVGRGKTAGGGPHGKRRRRRQARRRARAPDGDELDHSGFSFRLCLVGILSFDGFPEDGLCCLGAAANAAAETPKSQEGNDFPHKGTSAPPQGEARRPPKGAPVSPSAGFRFTGRVNAHICPLYVHARSGNLETDFSGRAACGKPLILLAEITFFNFFGVKNRAFSRLRSPRSGVAGRLRRRTAHLSFEWLRHCSPPLPLRGRG